MNWLAACFDNGMDANIDLAKLVGAASAPVALIIATCIYLGNLSTKYNTLFQQIRNLAQELRENPEGGERSDSVHQQLNLYERRIHGTMRSAFWLNLAIICFVSTVFLTGLSMLLPGNVPVMMLTAGAMFCGLLLVVTAVIVELWSNRLAKPTLHSELTSGTPQYEPAIAGHSRD